MSTLLGERTPEENVEVWTRWLADRTPRRSFLGKMGRGLVASSVGGAAALGLFAEQAYASGGCGCYGDVSVTCACEYGTDACPTGTCECGCWTSCSAYCTGCSATQWCDCCNTTSNYTTHCVGGCGPAPGYPTNCYTKAQGWPGGCGTGTSVIRCRYYLCTQGPACC